MHTINNNQILSIKHLKIQGMKYVIIKTADQKQQRIGKRLS